MSLQRGEGCFVQRDQAPGAGYRFRLAHCERFLVDQVDLLPSDLAQFLIPEAPVTFALAACVDMWQYPGIVIPPEVCLRVRWPACVRPLFC